MMEFHVHVDASWVSPKFECEAITKLGFWRSDFLTEPGSEGVFAPAFHLTKKPCSTAEFRVDFGRVRDLAERSGGVKGYLEGEFIAYRAEFDPRPFNTHVPVPLRFTTRSVEPGNFRETELHITLDRDRSDPRIIATLRRMGFFEAYTPKPYGVAAIFTIQGSRAQIREALPLIHSYLAEAGGISHGKLKEERIVDWWVSDRDVSLPPVIDSIL